MLHLQGAGVATVVLTFWLATYYNVIIGWAMFYLFSSFQDPLPWVGCNNSWNTIHCLDSSENGNASLPGGEIIDFGQANAAASNETIKTTSSSQEFYE